MPWHCAGIEAARRASRRSAGHNDACRANQPRRYRSVDDPIGGDDSRERNPTAVNTRSTRAPSTQEAGQHGGQASAEDRLCIIPCNITPLAGYMSRVIAVGSAIRRVENRHAARRMAAWPSPSLRQRFKPWKTVAALLTPSERHRCRFRSCRTLGMTKIRAGQKAESSLPTGFSPRPSSMITHSIPGRGRIPYHGRMGLSPQIAARVCQFRAARELSLEALAERSGVSCSMISLIERAQTSATAVVLEKLPAALGITLAAVLEPSAGSAAPWCAGRIRRCGAILTRAPCVAMCRSRHAHADPDRRGGLPSGATSPARPAASSRPRISRSGFWKAKPT